MDPKYDGSEESGRLGRDPEELEDYTEETRATGPMDLPFFLLTILILTIGVIMVLSASFARAYYTLGDPTKYFVRQLIFAVTGVVIMYVASRISTSFYRRVSLLVMAAAIIFLMLVPLVGTEVNGAKRWIDLMGITTFQPSEIAKLAEILLFANMICSFGKKMKTFRYGVLPFALIAVVIVALLYLEPHLSASVIILAIAAIMMFAGGTRLFWFGLGIAAVGVVGYITISKMGYAAARIEAWQHPELYPLSSGYQPLQSLYAIGSGGLLGLGIGQARQKSLYLPEEHNDYIFSVV